MSHTSKIDSVKITDIDAVKQAIEDLNKMGIKCSLRENATPRAYYADQKGMGIAPYVVHLQDCTYDVGLYKSDDGKYYEPRADLFAKKIKNILGVEGDTLQDHIGKLLNAYSARATMRAAIRKGYQCNRIQNDNGLTKKVIITIPD